MYSKQNTSAPKKEKKRKGKKEDSTKLVFANQAKKSIWGPLLGLWALVDLPS